jgi:hypothetical protein
MVVYGISFTNVEFTNIKKILSDTKPNIIPEIEIRLGDIKDGRFISSNDTYFFNFLKNKLERDTELKEIKYTTDTVYIAGDNRKIVSDTGVKYEKKEKKNVDVTILTEFDPTETKGLRFGVSNEIESSSVEYMKSAKLKKEIKRERSRKSYIFDHFTFDFTEVKQGNYITNEIECELNYNFSKIAVKEFSKFMEMVKVIIGKIYKNIHTLYSLETYNSIKPEIDFLFKNVPKESKPISIGMESLKESVNLDNYAVTNKLDGVGYQFFFIKKDKVLGFYLKNKKDLWKLGIIPLENLNKYKENVDMLLKTVFNVEVFMDGIYVFDTVYTNDDVYLSDFETRIRRAKEVMNFINEIVKDVSFFNRYTFTVKEFYTSNNTVENIQSTVKYMNEKYGIKLVEYNDGIILQPKNKISDKAPIYKWKFYSKITIDLLAKDRYTTDNESTYTLYLKTYGNKLVPFIDNNRPVKITVNNEEYIDGIKGNMLEGYVLEVGIKEEGSVYIHRIRFDKGELEVNFKTVVEKTWKDMQNELKFPYLVEYIKGGSDANKEN